MTAKPRGTKPIGGLRTTPDTAGWRLAVLRAGVAQVVFLVLFSYAFFFEGYTGLTVAIGAVVTLFVLMQMTGRVDWDTALSGRAEARVPAGRA